MTYLRRVTAEPTPQSEPLDNRQVENNAGGYAYNISEEDRVRRFVVLGTEGGTFYASERTMTKENTTFLQKFAETNGKALTDIVVEISTSGRAPKQGPGLFALAVAASHGSTEDRQYALGKLPTVARTASTLFEFVSYVTLFRGWGNALRRAVADWYLDEHPEPLGYQVSKYRSRHGYTHRDLLRLAHPNGDKKTSGHQALFAALTGREQDRTHVLPDTYKSFLEASTASEDTFQAVVGKNTPWEHFPTSLHTNPNFWTALLDARALPFQATVRNLPRLTSLGVDSHPAILEILEGGSKFAHPVNISIAQKAYSAGVNRNLHWEPNRHIIYALNNLMEASFKNITPSGKRIMVALDVSGSMGVLPYLPPGQPQTTLSAREMSAIMTLGILKGEKNVDVTAFTSGAEGEHFWSGRNSVLTPLDLNANMSVTDVLGRVSRLPFGGTDCALPMQRATKEYDAFIVMTDNETWAGAVHPMQALKDYRKKFNVPEAKLIVAAFTATDFTIADPSDKNSLDLVGIDSAMPQLVSDFIAGRV